MKEKGKGKGRWKEDSLRNVGPTDARTDGRTDGHKGDFFILCPMLCIALDRQLQRRNWQIREEIFIAETI